MRPLITHEELLKLLSYDPLSGQFTYITDYVKCSFKRKAGDIAGSVNKKNNGYIQIYIGWNKYYAHRLAHFYMTGVWPDRMDHINGITSDNRWCNLRACTQSQNMQNRVVGKNNKNTGIKGLQHLNGKFRGCIGLNKRYAYTPWTTDKELAIKQLRELREQLHGEFANHGDR